MLKVYSSGILIVIGMFAIIAQPLAGMLMLGGGIWLFLSTTPGQRHEAGSLFFGVAILGMIVSAVIGLVDVLS